MKRAMTIGVWLVAAALGANLARIAWGNAHPSQAPTIMARPIAPLTVVLVESYSTNPAKEPLPGSVQTIALRADGSHVRKLTFFNPANPDNRAAQRFISFASGGKIQVDDLRELRSSTFNADGQPAVSNRDPATGCRLYLDGGEDPKQIVLGTETVSGYATVRINLGSATLSYAQDLSCIPIKVVMDMGQSGTSTLVASSIKAGDPDGEYFRVAAHYKEVSPSIISRDAPGTSSAVRIDSYYQSHRCSTCDALVGIR